MAHSNHQNHHTWTFYRISGLDQVALKTGADLSNLKFLDQKLWVALSCPVKGLEIDERTLQLIDTDQNGRVRVPEILEAIDWCAMRLKNLDELLDPQPALPIALIDDSTPEGKIILSSVRHIHGSLAKSEEKFIAAVDAADPKKIFANTAFNGDGVISALSCETDADRAVLAEIVDNYGAVTDRSGQPGINQEKLDLLRAEIKAHQAWLAKGQTPEIQLIGVALETAVPVLRSVRAKIDDYFARASMASFDPRALAAFNRLEADYIAISTHELTVTAQELSAFPLAKIEANRPLPLNGDLNPAWATRIEGLRKELLAPFFGPAQTALSHDQWNTINARVAAFEAWDASRPPGAIRKFKNERIQEIATSQVLDRLAALIQKDKELEAEALAVVDVERLARYYRDLGTVLRNFVNFADFYNPSVYASFQAGTLYFDSRSCELCVRVDDPNAHSILASLSKSYIAYCDLKRGDQVIKIAACFTQGDSDYLMAGRNGLFYDRKGRDWDATITKIIDNPISLRQAFWSPYKKFIRFMSEQIAKRAAAADAKSDATLSGVAAATVAGQPPKPAEPTKRIDVGAVAALGVAVGALSTALAYFLGLFKGMMWWEMPLVILGVLLLISLPPTIIAWIKLRERTIGPILDATGWAINARVKINIPFGTSLTKRAKIPRGSIHRMDDPFADKEAIRNRRLAIVLVILVIAAYGAYAYRFHEWPFPKPVVAAPAAPGSAGVSPAVH